MNSKRDFGADITRIVAFCSVVAVHFFLNSGFYDTPVVGERMFLMVILRTSCMICVPLFLMLSGYLYSTRTIAIRWPAIKKHATNFRKLYIYIISVLFICIFKKCYLNENISVLKDGFFNALNFTEYSWYVNMYIGLFLMIPYFNILWQNIENREGHLILIGVCLFLTMAPSIFNIYDFRTPEALIKPWISKRYTPIVPDWWTSIYPITYYFIGAYLKKYVDIKKLNTNKLLCAFFLTVFVFGIYNIWRCYSIKFVKGLWCHPWGSFQITVMSILAFLTLNSIEYSLEKHSKFIQHVSALTFGGYLLSWISDTALYPLLMKFEPNMALRLNYFPLIVLASILLSLLLAYLAELIVKLIQNIILQNRKGILINEK